MSDIALADLGVNTIGDRTRLRELCTKYVSNQRKTDEDDENADASGTTLSCRDCQARKEPYNPTKRHCWEKW